MRPSSPSTCRTPNRPVMVSRYQMKAGSAPQDHQPGLPTASPAASIISQRNRLSSAKKPLTAGRDMQKGEKENDRILRQLKNVQASSPSKVYKSNNELQDIIQELQKQLDAANQLHSKTLQERDEAIVIANNALKERDVARQERAMALQAWDLSLNCERQKAKATMGWEVDRMLASHQDTFQHCEQNFKYELRMREEELDRAMVENQSLQVENDGFAWLLQEKETTISVLAQEVKQLRKRVVGEAVKEPPVPATRQGASLACIIEEMDLLEEQDDEHFELSRDVLELEDELENEKNSVSEEGKIAAEAEGDPEGSPIESNTDKSKDSAVSARRTVRSMLRRGRKMLHG